MSNAIQPQVDLVSTLVNSKNALLAVWKATSHDDVHSQALLTLERLGMKIQGNLSTRRISEASQALSNVNSKQFDWLKVSIGFPTGGVANIMRTSVSCIAAFLLVVACKTVFTNSEIAAILFDMIEKSRIIRELPISKGQIEDLVDCLAGYGDAILPADIYNRAVSEISGNLRSMGKQTTAIFSRPSLENVAEILSRVFEALQDDEVKRISLEGTETAPWLASVFLWLFPEDTECVSFGTLLFGNSSARISIQITDGYRWTIQEWRAEGKVSSVLIGSDHFAGMHHLEKQHSYIQLASARNKLMFQYSLAENDIDQMGQLAAALIQTAYEIGTLGSRRMGFVDLRTLCSENFTKSHTGIIKEFGWVVDRYFKDEQNQFFNAIRRNIESCATLDDAPLDKWILKCFSSDSGPAEVAELISNKSIVTPAIHVATEAVYYSLCDRLPSNKAFRLCTYAQSFKNRKVLEDVLFAHHRSSPKTYLEMSTFRAEALQALLPGVPDVNEADLAVAFGGYVAYSSVIEGDVGCTTTSTAISVVPGSLRYHKEFGGFDRLTEKPYSLETAATASFLHESEVNRVKVFHGADYQGIEARADTTGAVVEHLLSAFKKNLYLHTRFKLTTAGMPWHVSINWKSSIEAFTFASYVTEHDLTPVAEEQLAQKLNRSGIFEKIGWANPGITVDRGGLDRHITTTSSNDLLRFFEAGRWLDDPNHGGRKIWIREKAPLIQCIKEATADESENRGWVIIC